MDITNGIADRELCIGTEVAASVQSDPLADKFDVEVYRNGECDVLGSLVSCRLHADGRVVIDLPRKGAEYVWLVVSREQAIELRDALDILITNTRQVSAC